MRNYTVYFEIYNKKMKTVIMAESEDDAKEELKNKIKIHKIEYDKEDVFNQSMDGIDGFMDMLSNIKK